MRLEITRKTNLAISLMSELDRAGRRVSGKDLASAIGTTGPFLAQVIAPLVRREWVTSQSGRTGGYELVADAGNVSVLEVIEAVEGPTDTQSCVMRSGACSASDPCATHEAWSRARTALIKELAATPISNLVPQGASG